MADNATKGSLKIYKTIIEALKTELLGADSISQALKNVTKFPINKDFLNGYSDYLLNTLETSEALGRSKLVEKDRLLRYNSDVVVANLDIADDWFICDDNIVKVSFDLIPKEALDYLRYKSLTIAGVEHDELLGYVKKKLEQAIEQGIKFEDFKSEIDSLFDSYGITELTPHHASTVFRTNTFISYSVGQLAQVDQMQDQFPMWQYSAILDSVTRPEHAALNGQIFRVGEGPIPPIDYNCRCTAIYLHTTQTEGLQPLDWQSSGDIKRFDNKKTFETWKRSKGISKPVQGWIDANS